MKHKILIISLFTALGCSPKVSIDALPDAESIADSFFENFHPDLLDNIYPLYSDAFFTAIPKETWRKILPNVYYELGSIKSCEKKNWKQSTRKSTSGDGNIVSLVYSCKHARYDSTISFTIFKPLSGGKSEIYAQNFESLGLLLE